MNKGLSVSSYTSVHCWFGPQGHTRCPGPELSGGIRGYSSTSLYTRFCYTLTRKLTDRLIIWTRCDVATLPNQLQWQLRSLYTANKEDINPSGKMAPRVTLKMKNTHCLCHLSSKTTRPPGANKNPEFCFDYRRYQCVSECFPLI